MIDLSEYRELYLKTAFDLLAQLKEDFSTLKLGSSNKDVIDRLHRNAHSLKGQSLVMGYQSTGLLAKELEFIFRAIKDKQLVATEQLNQALADAIQNLYHSIENIKTSNTELDMNSERVQLQLMSKITS